MEYEYYGYEQEYDQDYQEEYAAWERRRALRRERMLRRRRMRLVRRMVALVAVAALLSILVFSVGSLQRSARENAAEAESAAFVAQVIPETASTAQEAQETEDAAQEESNVLLAQADENTVQLGGDIVSTNALLISLDDGRIVAQKGDPMARIVPASMTKVLTVLTAIDHVENLDDTFEITLTETDYSYANDCSNVGFEVGETPTIRDLFYGTILSSGADAAVGLADYISGTQEEFAQLMNDKLEELGIADSAHFTNAVGVYDENLYCTPYDMAVIMDAAMKNDFLREVLSAHTYTTSQTTEHPEGLLISNWFLRRIEDKDSGGGFVLGAKTGYVAQSGNCAVSYATDEDGKAYICVTADASSSWRCIYDHAAIYKEFIAGARVAPDGTVLNESSSEETEEGTSAEDATENFGEERNV
ncbi:MAG: serine hydrolase [Eubacteriales bacterium]|nr:serine hydrolase [Eubacteriales bacterium]